MQDKKLYVGNLNYSISKEQLQELFGQYGVVEDVKIIEGKGFAFVEMSNQEEAEKAKNSLNGYDFEGRNMKVDSARPKKDTRNRRY